MYFANKERERGCRGKCLQELETFVTLPGNTNWGNKEIVLTRYIVQRRIERLLCKVQAGVGNIVTLPKEGGVGRG